MPINFLGKILFPRQADWQRKKQMQTMVAVLVTSVLFAAIVAGLMFFAANKK